MPAQDVLWVGSEPSDGFFPKLSPTPRRNIVRNPFKILNLQFTIDKRPDLQYDCACYLEQIRHHATPLTPLDSALPRNLAFCTILVQINPLQSALTERGEGVPRQILLLSRNSR